MALTSRRLARILTRRYDRALKPSGLKVTQFTLLHIIGNYPGIGMNRLADVTDTDPTTLTRNLAVLERKGWLTVGDAVDDRRKRDLRLTEEGRRRYNEAWPLWAAVQRDVVQKGIDLHDAVRQLSETGSD